MNEYFEKKGQRGLTMATESGSPPRLQFRLQEHIHDATVPGRHNFVGGSTYSSWNRDVIVEHAGQHFAVTPDVQNSREINKAVDAPRAPLQLEFGVRSLRTTSLARSLGDSRKSVGFIQSTSKVLLKFNGMGADP
jgi:hypothetical protein